MACGIMAGGPNTRRLEFQEIDHEAFGANRPASTVTSNRL